jgi:HD-GYP domain-containing protein (c-di-GMP phosphodiesterase class II)
VHKLSSANPDLLIFLILRHDANRRAAYSITHALHVASVCSMMAERLEWTPAQRHAYIGAALTMNMSIVELQGRLAGQATPPTPAQRQQIHEHPVASANLLRQVGLDDTTWLGAVEQHHEAPGGTGYPNQVAEPSDIALRLRFVDMFTAKLSPRADRASLAPNIAARDLFKENNGHPHVAMLIRELGIYPPGCFVKLASGETAIVVGRRATANAPRVVCITNEQGRPVASPEPRDTSQQEHAVVGTVPEKNVMVRVPWDKLYEHCVTPSPSLALDAPAPTAA